jgi:putative Mg2+ transporter-C (MgtC) family protein
METVTIISRLLLTFLSALLLGLERQKSNKMVGFATFIFIALGSAALGTIVSFSGIENPIALLASIVTGIGFLGAGALVKGTDKVYGFTTAASIWVLAIYGLTLGIGEYLIASIIYVLVWVVFFFDKWLEKKGIGLYQRKLTVITNKIVPEKDIKKYLVTYASKYKIVTVEIKKVEQEMKLVYLVEGTSQNLNKMVPILYKEPWLKSCQVE